MSVWIPGGTSGIGLACAQHILRAMSSDDGVVHVTGADVDVRHPLELKHFTQDKPDITEVVYSVGINHLDWSWTIHEDDALKVLEVNVIGLINVLRSAPAARRVVVIGSDAAWRPMRTSVAYCASKAALHMAAQVIARERSDEDFCINVVAPGKVEGTPMTQYVDQRSRELRPDMDHIAYQRSQIPSGEFVTVEEVAQVVGWLLYAAPESMTGAIIPVNGARQ